jgi:hypothetical protein
MTAAEMSDPRHVEQRARSAARDGLLDDLRPWRF